MIRGFFKVVSVLLLFLVTAHGADGAKVESIGVFADQSASESVRKMLEATGYRVSSGGDVICEIWLRKDLPKAESAATGATYTTIPESALIGVLSFPKGENDFRGQLIKPGAYTLRYTVHPTDGNHLGISEIRDFLLLTPVAEDKEGAASYKYEELVKISLKTSGTTHPSPISLVSPSQFKSFPSVTENDIGHVMFGAKIKAQSGEMPIGFVVHGKTEQ